MTSWGKMQSSSVRPSTVARLQEMTSSVSSQRPNNIISALPANFAQCKKSPASIMNSQPQMNDDHRAPSVEFMWWLRDTLKDLNRSVQCKCYLKQLTHTTKYLQVEDIAQMLLSFPIDPDPLGAELISETVYGASTTLDGRRFAADFIAKRKADATKSRTSLATGVNNKYLSLADVVKTQPKPSSQGEWVYKVVKKKRRSGRI